MQKLSRVFPVVTIGGLVAFKAVQVVVLSKASSTPDVATGRIHEVLFAAKISHAPSYVTDVQLALMIMPGVVMLAGAVAWGMAKIAQLMGSRLGSA
jgi:hypothetical protein